MRPFFCLSFLLASLLVTSDVLPANHEQAKAIALREGVAIQGTGRLGRSLVPTDPILIKIAQGKWTPPKAGDKQLRFNREEATWQKVEAGGDAWFNFAGLGSGGYVYCNVDVPSDGYYLLETQGAGVAYVNGEPRVGDTYAHGYVRVPVYLKAGANQLLFQGGRGPRLRAVLHPVEQSLLLGTQDVTLPDLVTGEAAEGWGALLLTNASNAAARDLALEVTLPGGQPVRTPLLNLGPLSLRKVGFQFKGPAPTTSTPIDLEVKLVQGKNGNSKSVATASVRLNVVEPNQKRKITFVSNIDGSVQYYAYVPQKAEGAAKPPGLLLSLHGAGVEAIGQAACYGSKPWGIVVAPTNRRPFGFDWEDWGRLDALEVLEIATQRWQTDPQRTYLSGHSMGGHGVWHLGALYPAKFAAIGPSAGWTSQFSYANAQRNEKMADTQELLARTMYPSDTIALVNNYKPQGVYVLHGAADDNVSVQFARTMRQQLGGFHTNFAYDERPGAGHWWGNECVDWPPMMDFLAKHRLPNFKDVNEVEFVTPSPSVSPQCHWARVEGQIQQRKLSTIKLTCERPQRRIKGTTENVARLALETSHLPEGATVEVELDGQKLADVQRPKDGWLYLARDNDKWGVATKLDAKAKHPERYGTFKEAWRNRFQFVYGTKGTAEENQWAYQRARFDAERFWYNGNGSIDVIADVDFDVKAEPDRNVILYGNRDTNGAWSTLLGNSPVQVSRETVTIDKRTEAGIDLACLLVRPRPGSDVAMVAAVSGTGVVGVRLSDRLPYLISMTNYPDFMLLDTKSFEEGIRAVRGAGFFGSDWTAATGEFAWREKE